MHRDFKQASRTLNEVRRLLNRPYEIDNLFLLVKQENWTWRNFPYWQELYGDWLRDPTKIRQYYQSSPENIFYASGPKKSLWFVLFPEVFEITHYNHRFCLYAWRLKSKLEQAAWEAAHANRF